MKARQSNIEILRIVSMLAVVIAHYLTWGANHYDGDVKMCFLNGGINSILYPFLSSFASVGVICFVMITSYFISGSRVLRLDRLAKVWMRALFYSVVMALISSFFTKVEFKEILKSFAPIGTNQYWFVTKYIALIMLAPMLSIILDSVSKKGLQYILAILAFLTVTITCGIPYGNQFFEDNPLSVALFVFVYFIASYIKKYDAPPFVTKFAGRIFIAAIILQGLGGIGINILKKPAECIYGGFSISYNAFSIVPATALFIWFKNHKFKDNLLTRTACQIAPYTFAAYLVHDNANFRPIMWGRIFNPSDYWQTPVWGIFALIIPIAVILISCAIDMARELSFSILGVNKMLDRIKKHNLIIE